MKKEIFKRVSSIFIALAVLLQISEIEIISDNWGGIITVQATGADEEVGDVANDDDGDDEVNDDEWEYTVSNGNVTITKYNGDKWSWSVEIPAVIDNMPVTDIGDNAFEGTVVGYVTIPASVTYISNSAFNNREDDYLEIKGYLGSCAYEYAKEKGFYFRAITDVIGDYRYAIDVNYTEAAVAGYIGDGEDLNIPAGITFEEHDIPVISIYNDAFAGESIKSINIPDSITSIGNDAFSHCRKLTSITIPNSVTNIGNSAFIQCIGMSSITIPDSVITVGDSAFQDCSNLEAVSFGENVQTIGERAFWRCSSLTNISIPASVTSIGRYAFEAGQAERLTSIDVDVNNSDYSSDEGVLFNKDKTTLFHYPVQKADETYSVPDSVQRIGDHAFEWSAVLKELTVSKNVTRIGYSSLDNCRELTSITVDGDNAKYTDENGILFSKDKKKLILFPQGRTDTKYEIPNGVEIIGYGAFENCVNLEKVIITSGVTLIDNHAFNYCENLSDVNIPNSVTYIGNWAFSYTNLNSIAIPGSVISIGDEAFTYCKNLANIDIAKGVGTIGYQSFWGCESLASAKIPSSVSTIESYAFGNCDKLAYVIIFSKNIDIGYKIFYGNDLNTEIHGYANSDAQTYAQENHIPFVVINYDEDDVPTPNTDFVYTVTAGKITIDKYVGNETGVVIPKLIMGSPVTAIGAGIFAGCYNIQSVTILSNVDSIAPNAIDSGINIIGYDGTEAKQYAEDNGNTFDVNTAVKLCDVTGDSKIDSKDVSYLKRCNTNWDGYAVVIVEGDINKDAEINNKDITYLKRALADWDGYKDVMTS